MRTAGLRRIGQSVQRLVYGFILGSAVADVARKGIRLHGFHNERHIVRTAALSPERQENFQRYLGSRNSVFRIRNGSGIHPIPVFSFRKSNRTAALCLRADAVFNGPIGKRSARKILLVLRARIDVRDVLHRDIALICNCQRKARPRAFSETGKRNRLYRSFRGAFRRVGNCDRSQSSPFADAVGYGH